MNNNKGILIKCPTYKEAFKLRRALIELNLEKSNDFINDKKIWYNSWNYFNFNTIYSIKNGIVDYCSKYYYYIEQGKKYEEYPRLTVDQFIKLYIRDYED